MSNKEYFSVDVEKALATFGEKIRKLEEENEELRKKNRKLVDPEQVETFIMLLLKWRKAYGNRFSVPFPINQKVLPHNSRTMIGMPNISQINVSVDCVIPHEISLDAWLERYECDKNKK